MQNALNVLKKATLISIATIGFSASAMATNFGGSIDDQVTVTNITGKGVMISTPLVNTVTTNLADSNTDKLNTLMGQLSTQPTASFATFNTTSDTSSNKSSSLVSGLIAKAKNFIGLPYRFGGTSPVSGFDCSGFMQYVYKQTAGVNLPRTSRDMANAGRYVPRDQLKAGDMVFFKTHGGGISHVGMYIGDNKFIHSPRTGRSIEITNLNSSYYSKTFVTARRVLSDNA